MAQNKPHPIALTAAMLALRLYQRTRADVRDALTQCDAQCSARVASSLHRIAKACHKLAEAECNGEWFSGQRENLARNDSYVGNRGIADLDDSIARFGVRLTQRIARLNLALAPFALSCARRGDPRGFTLVLVSTDPNRPVPSNGMESGVWGVQ